MGITDSQFPPEVVAALAVKLTAAVPRLTDIPCDPGTVPPVVYVNDRDVGLTVSIEAAVTVNVTGTDSGLLAAPDAVRFTLLVCVPGVNPTGATDTLNVDGVVPLVGVIPTHVSAGVAVKLKGDPLLLTAMLCAVGSVPPTV